VSFNLEKCVPIRSPFCTRRSDIIVKGFEHATPIPDHWQYRSNKIAVSVTQVPVNPWQWRPAHCRESFCVCFCSCAMLPTSIKDRYCFHPLSECRNYDSSIRGAEDSRLPYICISSVVVTSTDGTAVYTSYYLNTFMIFQISWYH